MLSWFVRYLVVSSFELGPLARAREQAVWLVDATQVTNYVNNAEIVVQTWTLFSSTFIVVKQIFLSGHNSSPKVIESQRKALNPSSSTWKLKKDTYFRQVSP